MSDQSEDRTPTPQYDVAGAVRRYIQARWNKGGEARAQVEKILAEYRASEASGAMEETTK